MMLTFFYLYKNIVCYSIKTKYSLSSEEKIALAEELSSSVEEELMPVTEDEISFVKERLQMHEANPDEGMNLEAFKKYFADKYGF